MRMDKFKNGHVVRKEGLQNLPLTGKIEGKRSRGRQRLTYLKSLSKWMTERLLEEERPRVAGQEMLKKLSTERSGNP